MDQAFQPQLLSRLPEPPRRVVLLRPGRIGDFMCATPGFRALRRALPHAEIVLVGLPFAGDLVARSGALDRHEAFPGFPGIAEQWFDARRAVAFLQRLQAQRFDLAVQLYGSGVYSNPFALLLGARVTAGFVRDGDDAGRLDAALPLPAGGHEIDRVLALVEFLGAPACGRDVEFPLLDADHAAADVLLSGLARPLVALHATATDPGRAWSPPALGVAARRIHQQAGGTLVALGGPGERAQAQAVLDEAGVGGLNLAGRTSLPVLGAVLARTSVLVSADSGPAHVAYAVGCPSVTAYGDSSPGRWGPPPGPHRCTSLDSDAAAADALELLRAGHRAPASAS